MEKLKLTLTQKRVIDYILDYGGITTLQANVDLGETRLSARIFELKKAGVPISYEWVNVSNRYGEQRRVKKYYVD